MKNRVNLILFAMLLLPISLMGKGLAGKAVIKSEQSVNTNAKMLNNTLMIRVNAAYSKPSNGNLFMNANAQFRIIQPMLSPKLAIANDSRRAAKFSTAKLSAISKVEEPLLRTFIIEYDEAISPEKFAKKLLAENPSIEIAEPYYVYETLSKPNDPRINEQRLFNTIKALEGYDISTGSEDMIIGISDNGVDQHHEDIYPNIAINDLEIPNDGIDNDQNGMIDDYDGYNFAYLDDNGSPSNTKHLDSHGTEVAGIAGAATNNGIGIAGVGYKCKIFPMKCAPNNTTNIIYAYQSILYAALRGFKVLNCSWGAVKPFSQIEQSIIDFALASDVAIVAAGGNTNPGVDRYSVFYPASYIGVLAVGETDQVDNVVYENTTLSAAVRIMAPGKGNVSTRNNNDYAELGVGTSYASPVVAGVLGVVRSYFPNLSARQAIEWVRNRTDNVAITNFTDTKLIPGRVNLLKALTGEPMLSTAISLEAFKITDYKMMPNERFNPNDTVLLHLTLKNHLGKARNLKFVLSVAYSYSNNYKIIDSVQYKDSAITNEVFTLPAFSLYFNSINKEQYIMRVDVSGEDGYHDFFKFNYNSGLEVTTLANNVLRFSVGDKGTFGFDNDRKEGIGFESKSLGNHLYRGGLMATASKIITFSSIFGANFTNNDFNSIKKYIAPNNTGIMQAVKNIASNPPIVYGYTIAADYIFPDPDKAVVRATLKLKNTGETQVSDPSVGYFFDWDLTSESSKNFVGLLDEAIPEKFKNKTNALAEYAYSADNSVFVGSIAYSFDEMNKAQATGVNISAYESNQFPTAKQIESLSSNGQVQISQMTDVAYVIGMNFVDDLAPNQERTCYICNAIAGSKEQLAKLLRECADSTLVSVPNIINSYEMSIYPNPANEKISINGIDSEQIYEYLIINMLGEILINGKYDEKIDVRGLASGVYLLKIKDSFIKFIKY